jgi:hypothetical protein
MNTEDIYIYLGYALIAVLIYLIIKTIFAKKQPEGFFGMSSEKDDDDADDDVDNDATDDYTIDDDPEVAKAAEQIEALVTKLEKRTNGLIKAGYLVKNRKHWENLIIATEDNINARAMQLMTVLSTSISGNGGQNAFKTIENLITLNKYKQTLKENMTYLDGLA